VSVPSTSKRQMVFLIGRSARGGNEAAGDCAMITSYVRTLVMNGNGSRERNIFGRVRIWDLSGDG
jgi:hypothetical protein